ncbi:MAG: ATPase, T2SS/T4P/T4SS family, partial [Acidobacteria bacterium]|nr:ATPase, T2SS/T4P/T4SS family [Acidobacteriota bacterium]
MACGDDEPPRAITMGPPADNRQPPQQAPADALFGRLAVQEALITEDQLAEATRLQSREAARRRLGDIFLAKGWLSENQVTRLAARQRQTAATSQSAAAVAESAPPVVPRVSPQASLGEILLAAADAGASDIHLQSSSPLRFRIDGELQVVADDDLEPAKVEEFAAAMLTSDHRRVLAAEGQVDFAFTMPGLARFRANAYRHQRGAGLVLRLIGSQPPTLTELGLPLALARFTNYQQGLVLVTGPAGCGKTSTMAALLGLINEERREHVITAEKPIEFLHQSKLSVVNQRQVGKHSRSFAQVLRAALREDPDVIALGDLLDYETISLALTAAETGHLVLGTLHTSSAIRTIDRIIG